MDVVQIPTNKPMVRKDHNDVIYKNENAKFICENMKLQVKTTRTPFTKLYKKDDIIDLPIAHKEGRFYTDDIEQLYDDDQIVLAFSDENPNGSMDNITGVCNKEGNVVAVMPHPERAVEELLRSVDGLKFFESFMD